MFILEPTAVEMLTSEIIAFIFLSPLVYLDINLEPCTIITVACCLSCKNTPRDLMIYFEEIWVVFTAVFNVSISVS